jgi:hypothetical protein
MFGSTLAATLRVHPAATMSSTSSSVQTSTSSTRLTGWPARCELRDQPWNSLPDGERSVRLTSSPRAKNRRVTSSSSHPPPDREQPQTLAALGLRDGPAGYRWEQDPGEDRDGR